MNLNLAFDILSTPSFYSSVYLIYAQFFSAIRFSFPFFKNLSDKSRKIKRDLKLLQPPTTTKKQKVPTPQKSVSTAVEYVKLKTKTCAGLRESAHCVGWARSFGSNLLSLTMLHKNKHLEYGHWLDIKVISLTACMYAWVVCTVLVSYIQLVGRVEMVW